MSQITPELALVDPELAGAARASLPEPGQFRPGWAADTWFHASAVRRKPAAPIVALPTGRGRRALLASGLAAVAAAGFGVWSQGGSQEPSVTASSRVPPSQGSSLQPSVTAASGFSASHGRGLPEPSSRMSRPVEADRRPSAARTYTWPSVPGALGYRISIRKGDRLLFETVTLTPALELPAGVTSRPGRYTWSATPEPPGSSASPTRPVIEETFLVGSS